MTTWPTGTERPVRNRTPRSPSTWVARSRLVSPAEQAGVLPSHDTAPTAGIDWTFTPTTPPAHTSHPVTDGNREADPPCTAAIVDVDPVPKLVHQAMIQATWSLALSGAALWLVWLAGRSSTAPRAVTVAALAATVVCGFLLISAHAAMPRRER